MATVGMSKEWGVRKCMKREGQNASSIFIADKKDIIKVALIDVSKFKIVNKK